VPLEDAVNNLRELEKNSEKFSKRGVGIVMHISRRL
jgi:hypothetical protein